MVEASNVKPVVAKLPLGFTVEIKMKSATSVQCAWSPNVPDTGKRTIRRKVVPAYEAALYRFLSQAGGS